MTTASVNLPATAGIWLEWDGRRLVWDGDAAKACCAQMELCIDGVIFERIVAASMAGHRAREFAYSPSGCDQIEFSLRATDGDTLGASWRVLHGQAAFAGVHAWQGALPVMRPLPTARLPQWTKAPTTTAILVPIFNSPLLVARCIQSVLRWTQGQARLILIDDASDDPGVAALLAKHENQHGVFVHRNPHNLGYTRSTNLAIELAGDADVVLLNSDTQVGPRWLDTLRQIAYADDAIGTVTAVSDNAGAFSVPELEQPCPIPSRWTLPQAQRALLQNTANCLPELPTGNGFCMFIKRAMLDRVGLLDAAAFPSGYGEENDLCQRAERAGFRHVIAGSVLVHHERSASFGDARRAALGAQGMAVLRARYPDYETRVGATLYSFSRRILDYRVRRIYADGDGIYARLAPRPRLLVASRKPVGMAALQAEYDCFVLHAASGRASLRRCTDAALEPVEERGACSADDLADWLLRHAIELVHILDADSLAAPLRLAATTLGLPLVDTSDVPGAARPQSELVENVAMDWPRLYRNALLTNASFADAVAGDDG